MLYSTTECTVVDNSGVKKVRTIRTKYFNKPAELGSVILVSVVKKDPGRRKFKYGQLFKALVLGRGFWTFRRTGHMVKSINCVILLKKTALGLTVTVSKRIKYPVPLELRFKKYSKILSMGPYVYLYLVIYIYI